MLYTDTLFKMSSLCCHARCAALVSKQEMLQVQLMSRQRSCIDENETVFIFGLIQYRKIKI